MTSGTCIHYTGLTYGQGTCKCKAGVDLRATFGDNMPGIFLRMPCIEYRIVPADGKGTYVRAGQATVRQKIDRGGEVALPCALRVEPTEEQIEADRAELDQARARTLAAMRVASAWRVTHKPEKDRQEVVVCPVCQGRLHLSQSSLNGHCHGKCETEGCVSWME